MSAALAPVAPSNLTIPSLPGGQASRDGLPGFCWDAHFTAAVAPHIGSMVRLACRVLGSEDLAWDAVQEALLSLCKEGMLPPNPRGWLARAVSYRCAHMLRTRARRRKYEERAAAERLECSLCHDPARLAADHELCCHIQEALAHLPAEQRDVFVLREVEQMDYEAIARALGVPVGTVRSRLSRARLALRVILRDKAQSN